MRKLVPAPLSLVLFAACAAPAQEAAPPRVVEAVRRPEMPSGASFEAIAVGSWAEYAHASTRLTYRERIAVVARGAEGTTIEKSSAVEWFGPFVSAAVYAPGSRNGGKIVFQTGDEVPMRAQYEYGGPAYMAPDPRTLVAEETVTVAAGTFRGKHYRYQTSTGEWVDLWMNDTILPIGLIKLRAEQKQVPGDIPFTIELVAAGSGATPQITRTPIPFDLEELKRRDARRREKAGVAPTK